jgi:hypothetical protein
MVAMGMKIYAGKALCLPIPSPERPHLFIALTGARSYQEIDIAFVNLTSFGSSRGDDTTVVLESGSHSFIQRKTVANYRDARIFKAEKVQDLVHRGLASFKEDFCDEVLERLQTGALRSKYTPLKIQLMVKHHIDC